MIDLRGRFFMTSYVQVAPEKDILMNPKNTVLVIIDYQETQFNSIQSMDHQLLEHKINVLAKLAKGFNIPIILSTVNVKNGKNKDTISSLKNILGDIPSYDRSSINAWEDREFNEAVKATGRRKIIMAALWTEACLTFPTLCALNEGYEVYPVVDAVGGTSKLSHETALRRIEQAGAQLTTIAQLGCELQRDYTRTDTLPAFYEAMFADGDFMKYYD